MHSYGWEESEFPSQWVTEFNNNLNGLTVMSNQVKKMLIDKKIAKNSSVEDVYQILLKQLTNMGIEVKEGKTKDIKDE